ncbi:MAG TPA: TIGR01777 family oxidoreductase [Cyclobacteriaceae bacterium]|jgi:hypothetical protein|nr:TIGR01777 family oxidoreductase [Cyclobacteriaceae bacterium]
MNEVETISTKRILITGASGLIGTRLTEMLIERGHSVTYLGRSKKSGKVSTFLWDPSGGTIDTQALEQADVIVHLAGAGVAEKRWTTSRKREILESRTKSTQLLFQALRNNSHKVKTFVAASAIGYYGFDDNDKIFTEEDKPGKDFLSQVTHQWENEVDKIGDLGLRVIKLRIGIVLSKNGGALNEMAKPIKLGIGSALGTGKQFLSWIHIDDLCQMFINAIENDEMKGAYNGTTGWCTNKEMTRAIADKLKKPLWLPSVPSFILKIILGEMADIVLNGSKVSSEKIKKTGYRYKFATLSEAQSDLLK